MITKKESNDIFKTVELEKGPVKHYFIKKYVKADFSLGTSYWYHSDDLKSQCRFQASSQGGKGGVI